MATKGGNILFYLEWISWFMVNRSWIIAKTITSLRGASISDVAIPDTQSGSTNRGLPRCARNDVMWYKVDHYSIPKGPSC